LKSLGKGEFEGKQPLVIRVFPLKKILFDQILKTWGISGITKI